MLKLGRNGGQCISMYGFTRIFQYSSATNATNSSFMVDYLMNSLGFTKQEAIVTSSKVSNLKSTQNPVAVVDFLTRSGFDNTHIKKLVFSLPKILSSDVDKTLKPKMEAFQKFGLAGSALAHAICRCPDCFRRSLNGHLIPTLEVLKSVFGEYKDDNLPLVRALKSSSGSLLEHRVQKNLLSNVALLESYGLSVDRIKSLLLRRAKFISMDHDFLLARLTKVEEKFGIPRDSGMFIHGISALCTFSDESIESKFEVFKKLGWTESDILIMVRKNPYPLTKSESRIRITLNVWMNELGYHPAEIAQRACVLTYSLQKRVIPRNVVFNALKEKKLIKCKSCFFTCIYMTELNFFKKYVQPFKDEIHGLYDDYIRRVGSPKEAAK